MQDDWGREVSFVQETRGYVYAMPGWELVLPARNDTKALELAGMFDRPAAVPVLAAEIPNALRQIDADTDAIYLAVIGHRGEEYRIAQAHATAYVEAGYTGAVPASVASWAAATGWTAQQAADDILATAAAWLAASADIRTHRLACKEQARDAATVAALTAVMAGWAAYLGLVRAQLGI